MGVCPTPARHVARPPLPVLQAAPHRTRSDKTTTDPRDWRCPFVLIIGVPTHSMPLYDMDRQAARTGKAVGDMGMDGGGGGGGVGHHSRPNTYRPILLVAKGSWIRADMHRCRWCQAHENKQNSQCTARWLQPASPQTAFHAWMQVWLQVWTLLVPPAFPLSLRDVPREIQLVPKAAFSHSAGTASMITLVIPRTPANHPPTEACMMHSKQHRGSRIQDPGTRGYRWWKTAGFPHSAGTAHGAPPKGESSRFPEQTSPKPLHRHFHFTVIIGGWTVSLLNHLPIAVDHPTLGNIVYTLPPPLECKD